MKKYLLAAVCSAYTVCAFCQVQSGYVRTVGRPENKDGQRLEGVSIKVKGLHQSVVSHSDGDFEFNLQGDQKSYWLTDVYLEDYELNEKEVIGREFGVTPVAHEIVMVSLAEKSSMRQKVQAEIEKRYQEDYTILEKLLEEKKIENEEYRQRLQKIENEYDNRMLLVNAMVDRYSHTDYALIGEKEAEINTLIQNGRLEQADSVIGTLKLERVEADNAAINSMLLENQKERERLEDTKSKNDSVLSIGYNSRISFYMAEFQNDSVALYYAKLVNLDTTRIRTLLDAGEFMNTYLEDSDNALSYINSALRQCLAMYGEEHPYTAECYLDIASVYTKKNMYDKALEYNEKALKIQRAIYDETCEDFILTYNNIATVYGLMDRYTEAMEYYKKALDIAKTGGKDKKEIAAVYINLGWTCHQLGDFEGALTAFDKALEIYGDGDTYTAATCHGNLGVTYSCLGLFDKAMEEHERSLEIKMKIFGGSHSSIAVNYSNIGAVYASTGNIDKALEYAMKALDMQLKIYGENHPTTATYYSNVGSVYVNKNDLTNALVLFQKALEIDLKAYGDNHSDLIPKYSNIASVYCDLEDYDKAIEYYRKALAIGTGLYGDNHQYVAALYGNMGGMYSDMGDYDSALECCRKALDISIDIYGENNINVALNYDGLGKVYLRMNDSEKSLDCFQKSLEIRRKTLGDNYLAVAMGIYNVAVAYEKAGNYVAALDNYNEMLDILLKTCGNADPNVSSVYDKIGCAYAAQEKYDEAVDNFKKELEINLQLYGEDSPKLFNCYSNIGYAYERMEKFAEAAEFYEKALSVNVNEEKIKNMCTKLSDLYKKTGNAEKAKDYEEKAGGIK